MSDIIQYTAADMADQGAKQFRAGQAGMYTAEDMCSQASQGWRDGYRHAKGEVCPAGYVMVPVEPTEKMLDVLYTDISKNETDKALINGYKNLLAAAPDVQGEPVSLRQRLFNGWQGCSNHGCVVVDPKPGMMRTNGSCQCLVNASRSQLYMLQGRIQSVLSATPQPTEHPPAPDVAGLVEALEEISDPIRFMEERLEEGERLNGMAAVQLAGDASYLRGIARAALATHQKRETSHDNQ